MEWKKELLDRIFELPKLFMKKSKFEVEIKPEEKFLLEVIPNTRIRVIPIVYDKKTASVIFFLRGNLVSGISFRKKLETEIYLGKNHELNYYGDILSISFPNLWINLGKILREVRGSFHWSKNGVELDPQANKEKILKLKARGEAY